MSLQCRETVFKNKTEERRIEIVSENKETKNIRSPVRIRVLFLSSQQQKN